MILSRKPLFIGIITVLILISVFTIQHSFLYKTQLEQPYDTPDNSSANYHLITVKFRESAKVRLHDGKLISLTRGNMTMIMKLLDDPSIAEVKRLFSRPEAVLEQEQQTLQAVNGEKIADLNSYYLVILKPDTSVAFAKQFVSKLNQEPSVETTYFEPVYHTP